MALESGVRLGPYEIVSALGAGAMDEVYRARDTRLDRTVAIKVLSSELGDDSARRRFQREAQTASSLNHPHILTVYDVGEFEGRQYLVTEFVDGGTLKTWAQGAVRTSREALTLGERLISTNPFASASHFAYGQTLYTARRYEDAIPHLRRAIELDPDDRPAYIVLSQTYLALGKSEEAADLLTRARFDSAPQRGLVAAVAGRRAEALKIVQTRG